MMATFTAKVSDLKKAITVAALATLDSTDSIKGHALIEITGAAASVYSSDEDRIAFTKFTVDAVDADMTFTVDPKNILSLLATCDRDEIKFIFDNEGKTLSVYASEDTDAFVSFPSLDPATFIPFKDVVSQATVVDTVNAAVLSHGLKFIQGYICQDDKNKKYANLYIREGILYASNGSTKIAAYKSDLLAKIFTMNVRRAMLSPVMHLIDKMSFDNVSILDSEKFFIVTSSDLSCGFGFRKPNVEVPKMPVSVEEPQTAGFVIERNVLLKKISRLATSMRGDDVVLGLTVEGDVITIETMTERKSVERMTCARIGGNEKISLLTSCQHLKTVVNTFSAPDVTFYHIGNTCTIYSKAAILIGDTERLPFISVARITLPRDTKV